MFNYLNKIEEKHFIEENELFTKSELRAQLLHYPGIQLHALKLLIVPFCQHIVSKNMLDSMWWDVFFIVSIITILLGFVFASMSLSDFFRFLIKIPLLMAMGAIDLCLNLIVLCLSLITRAVSTIAHMIIYASRYESNAALIDAPLNKIPGSKL